MGTPESKSLEFVKESHSLALWMIQLADAKADILIAASAILAGLLVPEVVRTPNDLARAALSLAVGLSLLTAGLSLAAVFPRTDPAGHASLLYFVAINKFPTGEEYFSHIQKLKDGESIRELAIQTWELAQTQSQKYLYLRASVRAFGACLTATLVGVGLALALPL